MTLFEQVKECVTARQAAEHYGIKVKRNGMACCPFHKDRHPSMKVDKIYHCFACGVGGDAIDFTARLFGMSQYEAAKKMIEDFGLDIKIEDRNKYKRTHQSRNTLISKKPKVVMIREKLEQWLKHATDVLIRYLKWIQFWKEIYKPEPDEEWHELFTEALANERLSSPKASSCQTLSVTICPSGLCPTYPINAALSRSSINSMSFPSKYIFPLPCPVGI